MNSKSIEDLSHCKKLDIQASIFQSENAEVDRMIAYIEKIQAEEAKKPMPPQLNYERIGKLWCELDKKVEKAREEMQKALVSAKDGEHNQELKNKSERFKRLQDEQIRLGYWNKVIFDRELERRYQKSLADKKKKKKEK